MRAKPCTGCDGAFSAEVSTRDNNRFAADPCRVSEAFGQSRYASRAVTRSDSSGASPYGSASHCCPGAAGAGVPLATCAGAEVDSSYCTRKHALSPVVTSLSRSGINSMPPSGRVVSMFFSSAMTFASPSLFSAVPFMDTSRTTRLRQPSFVPASCLTRNSMCKDEIPRWSRTKSLPFARPTLTRAPGTSPKCLGGKGFSTFSI